MQVRFGVQGVVLGCREEFWGAGGSLGFKREVLGAGIAGTRAQV